jgi:hypothetical protein
MTVKNYDLWTLVKGRPEIDPNDLAAAVAMQADEEPLDYRTRLLIRDSLTALRNYWGKNRLDQWLKGSSARSRMEAICQEKFEETGFPSIERRLMEKTEPSDIRAYLTELGQQVHQTIRLYVGGSVALLLTGLLSRRTDDIDVVNEVPQEIRAQARLLDQLEKRYGLHLAHFQSHYLPQGWEKRVHSIEPLGRLQVYLVDKYDVFLSKLFSARLKDRDDLRMLAPQLDKERLVQALRDTTGSFRAEPNLLKKAQDNWQILFGEDLPS